MSVAISWSVSQDIPFTPEQRHALAKVMEPADATNPEPYEGLAVWRDDAEAGALLLREVARMPASAAETRNYLQVAMECAGDTTHLFFGEGRELGAAREIGQAGHHAVVSWCAPRAGLGAER